MFCLGLLWISLFVMLVWVIAYTDTNVNTRATKMTFDCFRIRSRKYMNAALASSMWTVGKQDNNTRSHESLPLFIYAHSKK